MESGWIKLHRSILQWQWITSPNHFLTFITLLIRANFKQTQWRTETINAGQLLTGRKQLSSWTGLSEMQIRRILNDLENSGEITIKKTNKYSIISITKWDLYQHEQPTSNQQVTNKEPTINQQVTTSKNAKNVKNDKNDKNILSNDNIIGAKEESPLASLFESEDIKKWLKTGPYELQEKFLQTYKPEFLTREIYEAYWWQVENKKRKAGTFINTWLKRSKTDNDLLGQSFNERLLAIFMENDNQGMENDH